MATELRGDAPPPTLYHGTTAQAWRSIAADGLKPMGRQHVHLSPDAETAREVARRYTDQPVLLTVRAAAAAAEGVLFERREARIWVSGPIPPGFVDGPATS